MTVRGTTPSDDRCAKKSVKVRVGASIFRRHTPNGRKTRLTAATDPRRALFQPWPGASGMAALTGGGDADLLQPLHRQLDSLVHRVRKRSADTGGLAEIVEVFGQHVGETEG